jgi:hypothetical protein
MAAAIGCEPGGPRPRDTSGVSPNRLGGGNQGGRPRAPGLDCE